MSFDFSGTALLSIHVVVTAMIVITFTLNFVSLMLLKSWISNLMSRTNETRHISWHEIRTPKYRLDESACIYNQHWNSDKCRY